ncbi:hypothetical protein F66182_16804, partial [Fusarium sp. NRRL 66182]
MGPCAEFSIYHLVEMNEGEEEAVEIGHDDAAKRFIRWEMRWIGSGPSLDHNKLRVLKSSKSNSSKTDQEMSKDTPKANALTGTHLLGTLAQVIRSKNSGPYEITLDIMFSDLTIYNQIKKLKILTAEKIASLYN